MRRVLVILFALIAAVLVSVAAAAPEAPEQIVVRVYDVRITGATKQETSEIFNGSDGCRHTATSSASQTWSSFHRGVRVTFTSARLGPLSPTSQSGKSVRSVRYTDNGLTCGPGAPPPCQFDRKHTVSSRFEVSQPGISAGGHLLGFGMGASAPAQQFPPNVCGGNGFNETANGGNVDITRRSPGSSYRVSAHWTRPTFLVTSTKWRPTLARLPYPFNVLYAGKPLTIRVTDTKDESKLFDSFSGSVTIVFTPRARR